MKSAKFLVLVAAMTTLASCGQRNDDSSSPAEPKEIVKNYSATMWVSSFKNYDLEFAFDANQVATVGIFSEKYSCASKAVGNFTVIDKKIIFSNLRDPDNSAVEKHSSSCVILMQSFGGYGKVEIVDSDNLSVQFRVSPNEIANAVFSPLNPNQSKLRVTSTPVASPTPLPTATSPPPTPTPTPTPVQNTITIDPEYVNCSSDVYPLSIDTRAYSSYWTRIFDSKSKDAAKPTDSVKCNTVLLNAKKAGQMVKVDLALGYEYDRIQGDPWGDDRFFKAVDSEECLPPIKPTGPISNVITINPEQLDGLTCLDENYSATLLANFDGSKQVIFGFTKLQSMFDQGVDFVKCWSLITLARRQNKPLAIDVGFAERAASEGRNPWKDDAFIQVVGYPTCTKK